MTARTLRFAAASFVALALAGAAPSGAATELIDASRRTQDPLVVVSGAPQFRPPAPVRKNPKLASVLLEVIRAFDEDPGRGLELARGRGLLVEEEALLLEIQVDPRQAATIGRFLTANRVRVRHALPGGLHEAWVPVRRILAVAANGAVQFIRPARLVEPLQGPTATQGLAVIGTPPWHAAAFKGSSVTIANIDSGFVGYMTRQNSGNWPDISQVTLIDTNGGGFGVSPGIPNPGSHGVATVEINFDLAPDAKYLIYDVTTVLDWIIALKDAADRGAQIVSVSLGAPLDGIGDGTAMVDSVAEAAEYARQEGALVVNAAGNSRLRHWGGLYNDSAGGPGTHDWGGSNVNLAQFCQPQGQQLRVELFWDDWTAVNHDYDLYLLEITANTVVVRAASTNLQSSGFGQKPQEALSYTVTSPLGGFGCPAGTGAFGVGVNRIGAATNRNLQLFTSFELQNSVPARSLGFPADSPAVMTVAAVDVQGTFLQEPYSSEGPVLGSGGSLAANTIAKPDIAAYANVATETSASFNGTSAATPHVAGAAALVLQAYPQYIGDPDELQRHLEDCAIDLGPPGQDTRHGAGRLVLCPDVRTRDNASDAGAEPLTAGDIWNSPDIRLCTTPNCAAHESPDFGNPAWIYLTLTDGPPATPTSGTLFVYYTALGGAALWNPLGPGNNFGDWMLINPGGTSVSLPGGQVTTEVEIPWNTVPAPGHYCLLSRWVSAQDPMTFTEVAQTTTNASNNNNISWKNFDVVDLMRKTSETLEFMVRNVDRERRNVDLELRADGNVVDDGGVLTIGLGDLFARWREAGGRGRNVVAERGDRVRLTGIPAAILGIPMAPGEQAAIELTAQAREPVRQRGTSRSYQLTLTQGVGGRVLGGASQTLVTRALDTDTDRDRVPDASDLDDDGDGVPDAADADPVDPRVGRTAPAECTIDLVRNRHTCAGIAGLTVTDPPIQGRAVVRLTLDPATSGFARAVFTLEFGTAPLGWAFNLGDSRSNDGHGGDAAHQTYSAEVQVLDDDLSVFGNDLLLPNPLRLILAENVAGAGKAVQVEVADGFVGWKSPGTAGQLSSPFLFGLADQRDSEGPVNRDVFAAFNRTIGRADRTGSGVARVKIRLVPAPPPLRVQAVTPDPDPPPSR